MVRRPSRPPCIRSSKLAIYPAPECADDARVILEYCTPSSSVFVSIRRFFPSSTYLGRTQAYQNIDRRESFISPVTTPNKHPITATDLRRTPSESQIRWLSSRLTYAKLLHHTLRQFVRAHSCINSHLAKSVVMAYRSRFGLSHGGILVTQHLFAAG